MGEQVELKKSGIRADEPEERPRRNIGTELRTKVKGKIEQAKFALHERRMEKEEEREVMRTASRKARLQAIGKRAELEAKEKVYGGGFMRRAIVPASTGKRKGHAERVRLAERTTTGMGGRIGFSNPFIPQQEPIRRPVGRARPQPSMDMGIDFAGVHGSLLPRQSQSRKGKRGSGFRWF